MKGKITTNISSKQVDFLIDRYLNGKMTNDEWSRLSPALKKKILREAKKFK